MTGQRLKANGQKDSAKLHHIPQLADLIHDLPPLRPGNRNGEITAVDFKLVAIGIAADGADGIHIHNK